MKDHENVPIWLAGYAAILFTGNWLYLRNPFVAWGACIAFGMCMLWAIDARRDRVER